MTQFTEDSHPLTDLDSDDLLDIEDFPSQIRNLAEISRSGQHNASDSDSETIPFLEPSEISPTLRAPPDVETPNIYTHQPLPPLPPPAESHVIDPSEHIYEDNNGQFVVNSTQDVILAHNVMTERIDLLRSKLSKELLKLKRCGMFFALLGIAITIFLSDYFNGVLFLWFGVYCIRGSNNFAAPWFKEVKFFGLLLTFSSLFQIGLIFYIFGADASTYHFLPNIIIYSVSAFLQLYCSYLCSIIWEPLAALTHTYTGLWCT